MDFFPNVSFRLTPIPGSYKVLPPIEKPGSREGFEQSPGQSASTVSDSYLLQQFKTRVSYKVSVLLCTRGCEGLPNLLPVRPDLMA